MSHRQIRARRRRNSGGHQACLISLSFALHLAGLDGDASKGKNDDQDEGQRPFLPNNIKSNHLTTMARPEIVQLR